MKLNKSFSVIAVIITIVTLCSLALPPEKEKPKNLKVLPKNISHDELDSIMKSFKTSLGVKCSFCHAQSKDNPEKLDFASDDNKHKLIARDMMRMTIRINKKFFKGEETPPVTCYTCHRGNEHPKTHP